MDTQNRRPVTPPHPRPLWWAKIIALAAVLSLVAAACGGDDGQAESDPDDPDAAAEEDWPDDDIRFIVPAAAGGGFDGAARNLQGPWQESLGVNIVVENQEGANFAIGAQVAAREGEDCSTIMFHAVPHLPFSYLTQDVDYTYDDFYPIGAVQIQPGVIVVPEDSPYDTFEDLIDDARERPGEVSASVSGLANNNYLALIQIQELMDVELNIIGYDGGGPARNAVVAGEVDFTHAAVFAALPVADETRILAVHQEDNEWPEITDDAPTFNEATGEDFGSNQSYYGTFVNRSCYDDYPERYERLVETFEETRENPDYQAQLEELGELDGLMDIGADEYHELILDETEQVEQAVEERPELQE